MGKQLPLPKIFAAFGAESRSGWTKIQETYKNVHPNLVLVLLIVRTEVEYLGKVC